MWPDANSRQLFTGICQAVRPFFPSVAVLGKGAVAFVGVGGGQGSQQAISGQSPKEANAQLYSAPADPTRLAAVSWIGDERAPFPCNFTGFLSSRPC